MKPLSRNDALAMSREILEKAEGERKPRLPESTIEHIFVISVTDKDGYDIPMAAGYTEDAVWALFDRIRENAGPEHQCMCAHSIDLIYFDSSTD